MKRWSILILVMVLIVPNVLADLDTGLKAYYPYDSSTVAVDTFQGDYNGTNQGTTSNATGLINESRIFDGGTDLIDYTGTGLGITGNNARAYQFWLKTTQSLPGSNGYFGIMGNSGAAGGYFAFDMNGATKITIRFQGSIKEFASTPTLNDGNWHHIVITKANAGTSANVTLYVDGSPQTPTSPTSTTLNTGANENEVGANTDVSQNWLGEIDEVGVWTKFMTPGEVTLLYNSGNGLPLNDYPDDASGSTLNSANETGQTLTMTGAGTSATTSIQNHNKAQSYYYTFVCNDTAEVLQNLSTDNDWEINSSCNNGKTITACTYIKKGNVGKIYSENGDCVNRLTSIENEPPSAPSGSTTNGANQLGQTLVATGAGAVDPEGGPITYYYQFECVANGSTAVPGTGIVQANSTNNTYSPIASPCVVGDDLTTFIWAEDNLSISNSTYEKLYHKIINIGTTSNATNLPDIINKDFVINISQINIEGVVTCEANDTLNIFTCDSVTPALNATRYDLNCTFSGAYENTTILKPVCYNSSQSYFATSKTLKVDTINPIVTFNAPLADNSSLYGTNFTINITISDENNYFAYLNISDPNGVLATQKVYNMSGTTLFNISELSNNTLSGNYTGVFVAVDGHTAKEIDPFVHHVEGANIEFTGLTIRPKNEALFDGAETIKKTDRYEFIFEKSGTYNPAGYDEFIVEGGDYIEIMDNSEYWGHLVVQIGDNYNDWRWIDFETEENLPVTVHRLDYNKVEVRVYGGEKDYHFKSIGALNVVNVTFQYLFLNNVLSAAQVYETDVFEETAETFSLNITYANLFYNDSSNVLLNYDGTDYNASFILGTDDGLFTSDYYTVDIISPSINTSNEEKTFYWSFEVFNLASNITETVNSSDTNQTVWQKNLGVCDATNNVTVGQFWFRDQLNGTLLNTTFELDINTSDGVTTLNLSYTGTDNNVELCTNLPNATFDYSVELRGTVGLQGFGVLNTTYAPKIYTFQTGNGNYLSNTAPLFLNLTLTPIENTTTIRFDWATRTFKNVDGTMLIYECVGTTPKTLIESVPIVDGVAYANLELVQTPYYYEVVIDGIKYTDEEKFSQCRLVEDTQYNFYVATVEARDVSGSIGLNFVPCRLASTGNIVTMAWGNNDYSDGAIEGCMKAYRNSIFNSTILFEACTSTSNVLVRSVPNDGEYYYVQGDLTQDGQTVLCEGEAEFNVEQKAKTNFDLTGLFAVILMILGLGLLWAGEQDQQVFGAILGLVACFWLGLTAFSWLTVSMIILYLVIGIWVGRYARK